MLVRLEQDCTVPRGWLQDDIEEQSDSDEDEGDGEVTLVIRLAGAEASSRDTASMLTEMVLRRRVHISLVT